MFDDVDTVAQRAGRVVGMAEDQKACLVGLFGGNRIGAGNPVIVLREPRQIGFVQEPGPYRLADVGLRGVVGELLPASTVEESRKIASVLAPRGFLRVTPWVRSPAR